MKKTMDFDDLIRAGRDTDAMRYLAQEYYNNGKMGHTRKLLLERVADMLDAAVRDLNGSQPCFSCKHFRGNDGDCFGASKCRLEGIKAFCTDTPRTYRVEIPDDGRKTYEWRGVKRPEVGE